jgi:acyl dehydratase
VRNDIKIGDPVPALTKTAYQRALDTVAFREDSSHKNEYARSKGYKNALLSGYVTCGYINQFMVDFFGPQWLKGGEISLSFVRAVYQGEQITISGTVVGKTTGKDGTRVLIDFHVDKADGTTVITGNASGVMG